MAQNLIHFFCLNIKYYYNYIELSVIFLKCMIYYLCKLTIIWHPDEKAIQGIYISIYLSIYLSVYLSFYLCKLTIRWTNGIQMKKGSQHTKKPPMIKPETIYIFVYQKSLYQTFHISFWAENHLLNLCSSAVNSQKLLCSQKAGMKWLYLSFWYAIYFTLRLRLYIRNL